MVTFAKTATFALAASALASAAPAMADPYDGYRHHGSGDAAGAAIAGGIIGLALGAIIASSGNHHNYDDDERRYHARYREQPSWNGQVYYNGAYKNGYNRYYDQRYRRGYQQGYSPDSYQQSHDGSYERGQ